MITNTTLNALTREQLYRQWLEAAWLFPPAKVIAAPGPGAVLFGALSQDHRQRVSFGLEAQDAIVIGEMLIRAGKEVLNETTS